MFCHTNQKFVLVPLDSVSVAVQCTNGDLFTTRINTVMLTTASRIAVEHAAFNRIYQVASICVSF